MIVGGGTLEIEEKFQIQRKGEEDERVREYTVCEFRVKKQLCPERAIKS